MFFHHTPLAALPTREEGASPKLASEPVSVPNSPIQTGAIPRDSRYPPAFRIWVKNAGRGWPAGWYHG